MQLASYAAELRVVTAVLNTMPPVCAAYLNHTDSVDVLPRRQDVLSGHLLAHHPMLRYLCLPLLLTGLASSAAQSQNRAPVTPTQRNVTERVSPLPGVTLPNGVGQGKAEPLPMPTEVRPNGVLTQPYIPSGKVTAGPVDTLPSSGANRRATPAQTPRKRP